MASNPFQTSPYSIPESSKTADDFADSPQEAVASKPQAPVRTGGAPTKADLARRASELGIDPDLALSLFTQESSGNWNSRKSPKGAVGGMQVMPGTYKSMMGTSDGQGDPWNNMEAGLRYIAYGQKILGTKDPELIAAGYHAGYDRKDLREGRIPGTNDGMISTPNYARSVAASVRKARGLSGKSDDENTRFADTPEDALRSAAPMFVDTQEEALSMAPSDRKFAGKPADPKADPSDAKFRSMEKKPEDQSWFSRFTEAGAEGYDDMASALGTTAWAFGKGTDEEAAAAIAESLSKQSKRQQTATQQEIDKAYKAVSDAKGVVDTTVAGAKALWASATNPEETSIEIARNAANSLPSLGLGVAGAGTGAAVGAAIGSPVAGVGAAPVALIGAIRGGRVGMAIGTTATELGAEVREMVQKRLQEQKLEPTAQNVLAIISDKGFKEQARKQGLAKGLTIAAVDQLFMGIGGKITTAPARKIALRELADQGMDIATRTARNKALSSAAGKATLEAAKPALAARIGTGVAATAVDAAGESFGEGLSQKVARGEVDYGEALREGVVSLGQSAAQTGIGTTIEGAKVVAKASREKVDVTGTTPSQAAGPLQRAKENAATEPERVIVTAKDGQVAGTVTGQTESGVQVTGDDGQVYQFTTGPDGVKIAPVPEPTPLSNAIETAANDNAATVQQETPEAAPEVVSQPEHPATTEAAAVPEVAPAPAIDQEVTEQPNIEAPSLSEMTEPELRDRLKYIAGQAKTNGGWNKMLSSERSKVEREINKRVEQAAQTQESVDQVAKATQQQTAAAFEAVGTYPDGGKWSRRYRTVKRGDGMLMLVRETTDDDGRRVEHFTKDGSWSKGEPSTVAVSGVHQRSGPETFISEEYALDAAKDDAGPTTAAVAQPTVSRPPQQQASALPKDLAGAKPRSAYGKKQFDLTFENDVDKAAYIAAQKTPSKRDADYVKFVMDSTGMTEDEVRAHGAQVKAAIKAMAKDASPGTLKVPEVARGGVTVEKTPAPKVDTGRDNITKTYDGYVDANGIPTSLSIVRRPDGSVFRVFAKYGDGGRKEFDASYGAAITDEQIVQAVAEPSDWEKAPVKQPAPTVGTTEEGAGAARPPQVATTKTASKEDLDHLFGVDKKRAKALERIAKGTAFFNDGVKAKDFIKKNGLSETHEVKKGKGGRWDVVAKAEAPAAQPKPTTATNSGDGAVAQKSQERTYNIVAINEKTGEKTLMTSKPVTHDEAVSIKSKISDNPARRIQLEEAEAAAQPESKAVSDFIEGKRDTAPTVEEVKAKQDAPGTRINGEAEREAADRLEKLHEQMGNITQRNSREGNAKAALRSIIEELRKPKTVVSIVPVLDGAANGLDKNYGAMADVVRDVAATLDGQNDELDAEMRSYERRRAEIDAQHKANREALKSLKVGDEVEYTAPGTYTQTDGSKREGRVVRGKIDKIMDADMGLVNVGNATVGARMLRKVEAAPLDAMAQGAEDAKAGKPRTPPAGMTAKQRFQWTQGYDSQAGTTPASQQPKTDTSAFANNKIFTADAVEKARARLRSKLGNLNSGIDPEVVIDGMTLAGAYIEAGTRSFAAYAKAMVDDFGPKIKPYLLSFYEAARNYPGLDTQGMTPVADAKAEFDALLTGVDLAEVKEAVGEKAPAPAKRAKKTGSSADATLTQDFGVEHINGYGDGTREVGNDVKDAFLKDARSYLKAVADILTQRGFMAHTDRKGKAMNPVNVNESGMAGSGYVSLALRLPEVGSGIYVHIGDTALRGMVPMTPSGIAVMFRATTENDPYGGKQNRWAPTDLSAADFADMLEKEARQNAKEPNNEPQKLDQSGPRELEGKQPEALQGAEPVGQAGAGSAAGSGADARGNERAGGSGNEQPGRMGNDAGEVPSLAARRGARRGGEQGGGSVQGSDRAAKPDPANAERGNQRELIPTDGTRAQDRADDFTITDEDAIGEGGAKTKFKQNVAAIRLLKQLQAEGRQATRAEQAVLAKYVGWGGIPQAFYRDNGEVSKGWEKEAAELKELMTPDELAAAAASTRNAHYTSPEIVAAVWDAAKHFGFQGGRVLEPSVGVGNFFGLMPSALRSASQLTGVELDHITGGIAKQLYPAANIQAPVGFQDFTAPDNYFDLAIGNPPFGREGIYDANRRKISGFSIHNYFFAKSIDTVKPNGVLAMVVTNRLLDSMGDKARQYIADRAEFLGAIRLPNNAFLKNAGTEVTTDIIFLRKLKDGEQPTGQRWMEVKQVTDKNGKTVPLNEYFVRNPDMMLGEFGAFGSMYSPDDAALVARPGQDTPALLREAMAKLPAGFMDPPTAEPTRETIEPMNDVSHVKVGSVFEQDGQIFERREDMLGKQQAAPVTFASEKAKERVSGMIKVRDALIAVRRLQLTEGVSDKALEEARAGLNKAYDAFVKAHGPINGEANKRLMRDDPTWPQLAALEDDFDKGITPAVAKTTGEKARPPSAKKAAIFFKRTQSPYKAPEKAATAKDALVTSLAERGRVDLDYMASLYGKTPEAIANELEGLIFEVVPGDYVTREEYLSGNVKKRLALTIELAKKFPRFQKNVDALREVQPADIEAVDIDVKTGAHWVPADVMQAFVGYITEGQNVKAIYNPITATWTLDADRVPQSAMTQWGTDRANVLKVLEAAANQKQIQIFDEHRDGTRTMNEAATTAANEKVERVKAEWKSWIWADDARRTRLHRIYNDTFNTDVQRDYDGSHLTFPGKVGNDIISLRPHQANAVWRMVQSGTTLLDHVVGAGKTFTMIAGVMEMRRMGLAKKPMLVVPNHLVGQWAEDFMKLYPGANILAATKKDFEKDNRKKLFARIATGDWDAVIVAHSSFGKVEVEHEFQEAFIRQQINDMDTSISAMRAADGKSSRNVKQIEKQKAALEEKLKRLFDTGSKDDNLYFGELGVDAVFVDEAHEFKNLGFSTGMQRVAGLGNPTGSNKAADMFMKVQSVLKRTGGKNVVFATGTPISNTMAEMYTMQRYLDYQTLKDQGIAHFDAWAKTFGEVVTDWELSPSGQYKMNSRFAKFVNMPELMQRYQSFADVINRDDINRQLAEQGKKLPVPKVATGKPENIVVERSQDQARYIGIPTVDENGVETYPQGSLVWRAENLPKKAEKGADNMLKIMSDARKAALDMRLIAPGYPDNPGSKVNVAADNIKAIYDKWEADKGTQLVFIDLSTPKGAVAKEAAALRELVRLAEDGDEAAQEKLDAMSPDELLALDSSFSVYDDLKAKLIGLGISEKEIAFIHDANTELQKEELFAKVRTGRVRVLFGSTAKMGAGMNVQERLVALHHLDAPWRPSDLEQREGRIIRQGNKLYDANPEGFEVRILRYATKQTLDSRMWQTIEAKARFIEQVRKGAGNTREVEDVAGEAANSAEMKAASSGNPLILEEMSLRQAIRKLENSQAEHNREQHRIRDRLRTAADMAKHYDAEAEVMEADAPKALKAFAVKIGKQTFDKHGEAGEAILAAVDAMLKAGEDSREIGTYGGFKLTVDEVQTLTFKDGVRQKGAVLTVTGQGEYQVEANPGSAATGLALRLQNTVKGIGAEAERARAAAQRNRDDIPKLEAQIKPWGQDQELAEAKARHAAVIEQLKPKKKEQPAGEQPAFSRLESVFSALEGDGRNRIMRVLDYTDEAEIIRYIDKNFVDILGELDDAGRVKIEC